MPVTMTEMKAYFVRRSRNKLFSSISALTAPAWVSCFGSTVRPSSCVALLLPHCHNFALTGVVVTERDPSVALRNYCLMTLVLQKCLHLLHEVTQLSTAKFACLPIFGARTTGRHRFLVQRHLCSPRGWEPNDSMIGSERSPPLRLLVNLFGVPTLDRFHSACSGRARGLTLEHHRQCVLLHLTSRWDNGSCKATFSNVDSACPLFCPSWQRCMTSSAVPSHCGADCQFGPNVWPCGIHVPGRRCSSTAVLAEGPLLLRHFLSQHPEMKRGQHHHIQRHPGVDSRSCYGRDHIVGPKPVLLLGLEVGELERDGTGVVRALHR